MSTTYCTCESPIFDSDYDAGCRRCALPLNFTPEPREGAYVWQGAQGYGYSVVTDTPEGPDGSRQTVVLAGPYTTATEAQREADKRNGALLQAGTYVRERDGATLLYHSPALWYSPVDGQRANRDAAAGSVWYWRRVDGAEAEAVHAAYRLRAGEYAEHGSGEPDGEPDGEPETRDSGEYGWLTVTPAAYATARAHGNAGTGRPTDPAAAGYWILSRDESGATVLYTGVTIDGEPREPGDYDPHAVAETTEPDELIAPERILRGDNVLPVLRVVCHRAGQHAASPIRNESDAVELVTAAGSRWFGVWRAWIGADLQVHVLACGLADTLRRAGFRYPAPPKP